MTNLKFQELVHVCTKLPCHPRRMTRKTTTTLFVGSIRIVYPKITRNCRTFCKHTMFRGAILCCFGKHSAILWISPQSLKNIFFSFRCYKAFKTPTHLTDQITYISVVFFSRPLNTSGVFSQIKYKILLKCSWSRRSDAIHPCQTRLEAFT